MIDCENEVYTRVAQMLRQEFPGIYVSGEYVRVPSQFPHVSFVMSDTYPIRKMMTNDLTENGVAAVFEVNIYSNRTKGKKTECKKIAGAISDFLYRMNFTRVSQTPVPNMEDASIYRIVARYRVITDGKIFYRR